MNELAILDEILAKPKKGDSKKDRESAIEALISLFEKTNDYSQTVKYLVGLHYGVCRFYLEKFCAQASDETALSMAKALINSDDIKTKTANTCLYPKGFAAASGFAAGKKFDASFAVLNYILSVSEKKGGFADGCLNRFKAMVADTDDFPEVLAMYDYVMDRSDENNSIELNRLVRFMKSVESMKAPETNSAICRDYDSGGVQETTNMQQEIFDMLRLLADNKKTVESLAEAIAQRDAEAAQLRSEVQASQKQNETLRAEISAKNNEIDDLNERLGTALKMDEISKNQELATLKNDISESLELDYSDFVTSKNDVFSEGLFEHYRATLSRIFKLLKRFDIHCE